LRIPLLKLLSPSVARREINLSIHVIHVADVGVVYVKVRSRAPCVLYMKYRDLIMPSPTYKILLKALIGILSTSCRFYDRCDRARESEDPIEPPWPSSMSCCGSVMPNPSAVIQRYLFISRTVVCKEVQDLKDRSGTLCVSSMWSCAPVTHTLSRVAVYVIERFVFVARCSNAWLYSRS
jgi:hypothetical protein